MIVIRFFRSGKRNQAFFKVVVTDKRRAARGGRFIEELGYVNPHTKKIKINDERAKYWLSVGAQPSDTVHNLLVSHKIIEGKKIPVHKEPPKKEGEQPKAAEAPKAEEAAPVETPKVEENPAPAAASAESSGEPKATDTDSSGEPKEGEAKTE